MDTTIRGNLSIAHGIAVAAAALLAAWLVNHLNQSEVEPTPSEVEPEIRSPAEQNVSGSTLNRKRLASFLGIAEDSARESVKGFEVRLDIAKSALRLRLLGTLTSAMADWTFASILDLQTQSAHTYRVGDAIEGAEIVGIERDRVLVMNQGRREFIDREPGAVGPATWSPPPSPREATSGAPSSPQLGEGIRAISQTEYEVLRSELEQILSNSTSILSDARVLPSISGDRVDGMKLYSIRPGSIYSRLGLQNGDVVERINGSELNNIETGLELFGRLRGTSRIDVDIRRNGSTFRRMYRIR